MDEDPFHPGLELNTRFQYALMRFLNKLQIWLPNKVAYEIDKPISKISYNDEFDNNIHETIMMCLSDERCVSLERAVDM